MTHDDLPRIVPFVGPRPYKIGEKLFGRERERLELLDLVIAERIVLLYSPSGAGKTSLLQAALVPALRDEGFAVPTVARITFDTAGRASESTTNRYVFAMLLSLEEAQPKEQQSPLAELARMTLQDYLEKCWAGAKTSGGLVLILDQFEEIFTIDPTDILAKKEFFAQLGAALYNPQLFALLSMREEHVASLDSYRKLIPTRLKSTFRLELLNEQQARQTMQEASAEAGVEFTDAAARKLSDDLRRVQVQRPSGLFEEQLGPTIEPTQLQVVCLRLWSRLPADKTKIDKSDVAALGNVDTALADYYAETLARLGSRERLVRDWIEDELITQRGLRNQILKDDAFRSGRLDVQAVFVLDKSHLVREELRRGVAWLELAHDRLVEPIRRNNATWREANLSSFQRQAALWEKDGRPSRLELKGEALSDAEGWVATNQDTLTPAEQSFIKVCVESRQRESQSKRVGRIVRLLGALIFVLVIPYLGYFYWNWLQAQPWAFVTSLIDGKIHSLQGDAVSIGRTAGPIQNKIDIPQDNVSRLQIFVSRNLQALDARSLNGTIVNARFLRYGTGRTLEDGDLVVLAGVAPFRFSVAKRSLLPFIPARLPEPLSLARGAWAVLIEGESRRIMPLIEREYFLGRAESEGISLTKSRGVGSLLKITRQNDGSPGLERLKTSRDTHLFALLKFEDRTYYAIEVPPGAGVSEFLTDKSGNPISGAEYTSKMSFCFGQLSPDASTARHGTETALLEIDDDSKPDCTLGPFQIVSF